MAELYKLENQIKHYAWGSADMIPALTGKANPSGEPWAELWMGIHPAGPSTTTVRGKTIPLSELAELPFLFKFLAAGSPLSIQAHPNLAQAKEGYERENKEGIPLSAANRNYRDPNHKPEIICALSDFTAMAGFRDKSETIELLSMISGTENLRAALNEGYRPFLSTLFGLSETEKKDLNNSVLKAANQEKNTANNAPLIRLCEKLACIYPNDPGIISPLYLNVINLKPFEAIFLPAGILHAYISGLGMECMANSDNVLRGGLTPKHIDIQELFSVLNFEPFKPEILKPVGSSALGCYSYARRCTEFSLYLIQCPAPSGSPVSSGNRESPVNSLPSGGTKLEPPGMGIFAVYNGAAEITVGQSGGETEPQKTIVLNKGESAFITRREEGESLFFTGKCTVFAALVPEQ